jgi:hypothetical protein
MATWQGIRIDRLDAQKVEALQSLLNDVIHTLNLKQYEIEDATRISHQCEVEANNYRQQMINILHSVPV